MPTADKPALPARLLRAVTALSIASLGVVVGQVPAAQAAEALDCSAVYAVVNDTPPTLAKVDPASGGLASVASFAVSGTKAANGLGISADGTKAFTVQPGDTGTGRTVYVHDRTTGTTTALGAGVDGAAVTHGAVNPLNGHYYYGGYDSTAKILEVYGFNTRTNSSMGLVAQGAVPAPNGGNGDWTFDRRGRLYTVVGTAGDNVVSSIDQPIPTSGSAISITGKEITRITEGTDAAAINGIAFAGSGYLYLSSTSTLFKVNPSSGGVEATFPMSLGSAGAVDLASCASPTTITVQGSFPDGRVSPADQTTVTVTGGGIASGNTGTTSGTEAGDQDNPAEAAGPVFALAGKEYTVSQSGPGTTEPEYQSAWSCTDQNDGSVIAGGTGSTGSFTMPARGAVGVSAMCTFTSSAQLPAITLDKRVEEQTGDTPGSTVTFGYVVTNTGTAPVDVTVDDPGFGPVTCPSTVLARDTSVTCTTAPYVIRQGDVDAGGLGGPATATGVPTTEGLPTVTATDALTVSIDRSSALTVRPDTTTRDSNRDGLLDAGDTVAATYLVTNTGNTTLQDVEVTTAGVGPVTCPATPLSPGDKTECATAAYVVTTADETAGTVDASATASATAPDRVATSAPAAQVLTVTAADPRLVVSTSTDVEDVNHSGITDAGDTLAPTYTVTNEGNVTLGSVAVTSSRSGTVACDATTLAPGASTECRPAADSVVTEDDEAAGAVSDSVKASAETPDGSPVLASDTESTDVVTPAPQVTLTGHEPVLTDTSGTGFTDAGDHIRFRYTVTNDGNVPVTGVAVVGSVAGTVACDATTLAVEATTECVAEYVVNGADEVAGQVAESVHAVAVDPDGAELTTNAVASTTPVQMPHPAITVAAHAHHDDSDTDGLVDAGERVQYSYTVASSGDVPLSAVTVADTVAGPVTCTDVELAPGASTECAADEVYVVTPADMEDGGVRTTATATGTATRIPGGGSGPVTAEDTTSLDADVRTGLSLTMSQLLVDTDGDDRADAGERIRYTFRVVNTGTVMLTDVGLAIPVLEAAGVAVRCDTTTLAPGATTTCEAEYTVTAEDAQRQSIEIEATARGCTLDGCLVSAVTSPADSAATPVDTVTAAEPTAPEPTDSEPADATVDGLPETGGPAGSLLAAGLLSVAGGTGVLLASRRRAGSR
ncbi:MAG TPA: hypothetical protein VFG72_05655 [Marmoricola sp.]|nr:hypothetical protein [Marmoricola sp.]